MDGQNRYDIPTTRITRDEFNAIGKGQRHASKADGKQPKAEIKEALGGIRGSGFSKLFRRSSGRDKDDSLKEEATLEGKKPAGLMVGTADANRLRPDSALASERPGSAASQRSLAGSGSLLSPRDRPPKSPKSPSNSLWERPTRAREGDVDWTED
ncbi:MAG: hypothetical protein MMC23_004062 [Stictis urceolatum]|nr:hypothetical protein [Stictis urceolata]